MTTGATLLSHALAPAPDPLHAGTTGQLALTARTPKADDVSRERQVVRRLTDVMDTGGFAAAFPAFLESCPAPPCEPGRQHSVFEEVL
jgi:hypothetical protein